jgi:hypothetical protein
MAVGTTLVPIYKSYNQKVNFLIVYSIAIHRAPTRLITENYNLVVGTSQ